jgi:outer membrane protein assembly factor BamB
MQKKLIFFWLFFQIIVTAGCSPAVFLSASQRLEREGDELSQADRISEASLAFFQAVHADPENRSAIQKLAQVYAAQGRSRSAIQIANHLTDEEKVNSGLNFLKSNPEDLEHIKFRWIMSPEKEIPVGIAAIDDMVVVSYQNGTVSSLLLQNGTQLWSRKLPDRLTAPPVISEKFILVGCESGMLIALDRISGEKRWEIQLPGAVYGKVLVDGGTGYIGSYGGIMTAVLLEYGKVLWQYDAGSPILAGAMLESGSLFFGASNGSVFSLISDTGASLWEKPARLSGGIETTPVLAGIRLLIGSNDSRIYAMDLDGKNYFWSYSAPDSFYANPLVHDNQVFVFSIGQSAAGIDVGSGRLIWQRDLPVAVRNTPVLYNGVLFFTGTTTPFLYLLDAKTGDLSGQVNTGDWIEVGPILESGYLLLAGKDGAVLAYQIIQD